MMKKGILAFIFSTAMVLSLAVSPVQTASAESPYVLKDGYLEYHSDQATPDKYGYIYMDLFEVGTVNHVGAVAYDADGNLVYKEVNDEILVDKRKVDAYIVRKSKKMGSYKKSQCDVGIGLKTAFVCRKSGVAWDESLLEVSSWSSDSPDIALVDKNGVVTAKKTGKAKITAVIKSNMQEVEITVNVVKNQKKLGDTYTYTKAGKLSYLIYYDGKGNLKLKITAKNITTRKTEIDVWMEDFKIGGKKVKDVHWNVTVKKGKSKSKTFLLKSSNANGTMLDLVDDATKCSYWRTVMG